VAFLGTTWHILIHATYVFSFSGRITTKPPPEVLVWIGNGCFIFEPYSFDDSEDTGIHKRRREDRDYVEI
jgi:hypothetical protein